VRTVAWSRRMAASATGEVLSLAASMPTQRATARTVTPIVNERIN
jgi:hypothetical protein